MSQYNKVITLLDDSFAVYGDPIAAWESLAYSDAWDKHGTISLVAQMDYFADLSGASWMEIDGRVYECETITSEDDSKTVKVTGCSLNVLFDRIVITAKERLQGRLEERIRYLVNKYAVTGSQAVTGLTLGTDNAYARAMDATTIQWQTLSEFLYTQMNQRGFSYKITHNGSGALQFALIQALDRTQDQTVNPNVQLSTTAEIEKATYKKSIKDFRNYAIVHDDDETNPQVVHVDLSNGAAKRVLTVSGRAVGADDSAATNLYVMVGASGMIKTSTDGINWTTRTSNTTKSLWSIDYQNGKFIAGGADGIVDVSSDGVTWVVYNTGSTYAIEGVNYTEGIYIAFDAAGAIYYSYDTSTWLMSSDGANYSKIVNCIKTNDEFIAYASWTSGVYKLTSYDGTYWNESLIPFTTGVGIYMLRTQIINDLVVCIGHTIGASPVPISVTSSAINGNDAINAYASLTGSKFLDLAAGAGVFVACGQPNILQYSTDGIDWTDCTPAGSIDYVAITYDGEYFYAYGYTVRKVSKSADGINWTNYDLVGVTSNVDAVIYGTSSHSGNLYQVGVDALQSSVVVEALDGDVNQELAPEYEIDYNIGDVIDTLDPVRNIAATKRVYSVDHIIDKNNDYAIVPKLGKDFLTLRQLIAKEIKNNGI